MYIINKEKQTKSFITHVNTLPPTFNHSQLQQVIYKTTT